MTHWRRARRSCAEPRNLTTPCAHTNVVRVALENAVSVASVLLLTEATMTEIQEPLKPGPVEP
ncbi:MAG TPA: hypothetical protein VLB69_05085 [Rudaea sp.]|nr:hypothetical protein [Rudaea sp.]